MQILTEIGEIGIQAGEHTHVLRPTLYAMTQIGDPEEIVRVYASVMAGDAMDALSVIFACSESDVSDVFGWVDGETWEYVKGAAPLDHLVAIGQCLVRHGVTGALDPLPKSESDDAEYTTEFVARDYVAAAMAHLGISEREAWSMTMTSLVAALRAKFPPQKGNEPGARAPSKAEHDATMEWFESIEAARKMNQGAH